MKKVPCKCGFYPHIFGGRGSSASGPGGFMHSPEVCEVEGKGSGRKDDDGKLPYGLLPWKGVEQIVKVLQYGAKKYEPENWRKVANWRARYFQAAMRHVLSWFGGEKLDAETKLPHLAHAACCVLFLLELDV